MSAPRTGLAANLPDDDTEPCFDCEGVGTVILGEWNNPSSREVACETCGGWGVTDVVPERQQVTA